MANFFDMFVNFMLIGLVVFGVLAFSITYQEDNSIDDKIVSNNLVNNTFSDLGDQLGDLRNQSQAQKTLFESENPTVGFGTILLFSIVSAGKVFNSMIIGIFNTITILPVVVLGVDPVIISIFSTVLVISIIIGLWIVYKLGG